MEQCVICNKEFEEENAAVLEMGAYGTPKYLCPECSKELDTATLGTDISEIGAALERISKKVSESDISAKTFETIKSILSRAAERAKAIKEGTYDFSLDNAEPDGEGFDEVPEELRETEEDIALDKADEEYTQKVNNFLDYVALGAVIGIAIFAIWKILDVFVL